MTERPKIRFFIDHNVADSVGRFLDSEGHDVILLRTQIAPNSPDPLVAAISEMNDAVLVSHDTDFKNLLPRVAIGQRQRFRRLSRIGLRCPEPRAAERIASALSLIEHEWEYAKKSADPRIDLSPNSPPVKSRVLGCRHGHRDGVSLFGRASFSVPAISFSAVARSLGQAWPQATGEAGAQRA